MKNTMKTVLTSFMIAVIMIFGISAIAPMTADAADEYVTVGAFQVKGDASGYTYENNTLKFNQTGEYTVRNIDPNTATTDRIEIHAENVVLTLAGVNIKNSLPPMELYKDNLVIILAENTVNTLDASESAWYAGLFNKEYALTIRGDGTLIATGGYYGAGIGGGNDSDNNGSNNGNAGNITIEGGTVTATGGDNGAGIGGGKQGSVSNITISGGTVIATGGKESGAGIGGSTEGSVSGITVSGGTVTATGGQYGAGIGGSYQCNASAITISGGTVTATGGRDGAGIGGGGYSSVSDITISGGTVTATGGSSSGADIGGGTSSYGNGTLSSGENGGAVVQASSINADKTAFVDYIEKSGTTYTVHGNVTLGTDLTIAEGETLIVPENATLTVPTGATLINNGTISNSGGITCDNHHHKNGVCTICGVQLAASLTTADEIPVVTYYPTLEEAIEAAKSANDSTITLLDDCTLITNGYTIIESNVCIDLNGNNIIGHTRQYILIQNTVTVTMMDDSTTPGSVSAKTNLKYGTLVVRGGKYASISASDNSTLQIHGGEFEQVSVISNASAELYGGSYAKLEIKCLTGKLSDILSKHYYIYDANKQIVNAGAVSPNVDNNEYYTVENVTVEYGAVITEDMITVQSVTYNGETQHPAVTITVGGVVLEENKDYNVRVWPDDNYYRDAGEWELFIIFDVSDAYTCNGENIRMLQTVHKATATVTAPTPKTGLIYNGTEHELINVGDTTGGTLHYSLDNTTWSAEIPVAANAGTYTVYYKVVGGANYEDVAAQSVEVTIAPKNITEDDVELNGTLTYNGSEQTQQVITPEGTTYTATDNTATDVGDYTMTVTVSGNYVGTVTKQWSIGKKTLVITADNKSACKDEDMPTLTYTVEGLTDGDALTVIPDLVTNAVTSTVGVYEITVSGAEASENYTITYVNGALTVREHAYNGVVTMPPTCVDFGEMTYTCAHDSTHTYTEPIPIDENVHSPSAELSAGDNGHWHDCQDCGAKLDLGDHNYKTEWSYNAEWHWHECEQCGFSQDVTGHLPNEDDGDCTTDITCSLCGVVTTQGADAHTGGTATCEEKAKCTVCDMEYGELAAHSDSDGNGKCDLCEHQMSTSAPGTDDPDAGTSGDSTPGNTDEPDGNGGRLGTGAIVGIVIGSVAVVGIGGFSILWFGIKKKKWSDLFHR